MDNQCSSCVYLIYDEDYEEYVCDAEIDQDDYYRLMADRRQNCPHYRNGDEYLVVRHQI